VNPSTTVSAVIPNWNRADLLTNLLADLARQTHPVSQVVVVDNGSTDASVAVAEAAGATVLRMDRNEGFARAVNRGIAGSDSEWVLILNNDVTFGSEWLQSLLDGAGGAGAWFAVGKLTMLTRPGYIDGTYDAISRGATTWRCGHGRADGPEWRQPCVIQFAPMTATLIRRAIFDQDRVGLLDGSFESYLEDIEFGVRLLAHGCTGVYVPEAVAAHAGSATLGAWHKATVRRIARNQVLLVRKHFQGAPLWPIVVAQLLWGLTALRHGAGLAWLRGKLDGFRAPVSPVPEQWRRIRDGVIESESEIRRLQQKTGFDLYWRLYFALVRG
jgi:GT2 family glycosyltransferase